MKALTTIFFPFVFLTFLMSTMVFSATFPNLFKINQLITSTAIVFYFSSISQLFMFVCRILQWLNILLYFYLLKYFLSVFRIQKPVDIIIAFFSL